MYNGALVLFFDLSQQILSVCDEICQTEISIDSKFDKLPLLLYRLDLPHCLPGMFSSKFLSSNEQFTLNVPH